MPPEVSGNPTTPIPTPTPQAPVPRRWPAALAAVLVAAVYLACVHDQWWPTSDSALYVGLGRSIDQGQGYRFNGVFCDYVTPGFPLLYALCHRLGGSQSFLLAHLAVTLSALACLGFVYGSIRRLADRPTALAVALMTGGSYLFFYHANLFLTDVPFLGLFWALFYCALRYLERPGRAWLLAATALAVLGIILRAPGLTVIGPLAVAMVLQRQPINPFGRSIPMPPLKSRAIFAGTILVAACATAGVFYLLAHVMSENIPPYVSDTAENLRSASILASPLAFLRELTMKVAWPVGPRPDRVALGLVLIALGAVGLVRMARQRRVLVPVTMLLSLCALLLARDVATMPDRYLLPLGPLMSLAILEGLWRLLQLGGRLLGRTAGDKTRLSATCALTVLALAANGPAVGNNFLLHACYGHSDQFLLRIGNGSLAGLADMAEIIKEIPPEHGPVTSFYPDFRILYLLSGRQIVYPPLDTCDTPAEIEFFMEHMSPTPSYYIVVGDEDEIFNDALLDQLAKPSAFHLLHTQHHCRLYQRMTTPTHPDAGEATEPASK